MSDVPGVPINDLEQLYNRLYYDTVFRYTAYRETFGNASADNPDSLSTAGEIIGRQAIIAQLRNFILECAEGSVVYLPDFDTSTNT